MLAKNATNAVRKVVVALTAELGGLMEESA